MSILTLLKVVLIFVSIFFVYKIYLIKSTKSLTSAYLISSINKQKKKKKSEIADRDFTRKVLNIFKRNLLGLSVFDMNKMEKEKLVYYTKRLRLTLSGVMLEPDDIRALLIASEIVFIIMCIIVGFIDTNLVIIALGFKLPVKIFMLSVKATIDEKNENLMKDFKAFYAEFYYNYKYKSNRNIKISTVALRYRDRACNEMKQLIDNLRADCTISEEFALDNMKDIYRIVKIQRMADAVRLIITGQSTNVENLINFKTELDNEYRDELDKRFKRKEEIANICIYSVFALAFEFCIMFLISSGVN